MAAHLYYGYIISLIFAVPRVLSQALRMQALIILMGKLNRALCVTQTAYNN